MHDNIHTHMRAIIDLHREVLLAKGFRAEPVQDGMQSWRSLMKSVYLANPCLCPDQDPTIEPANTFCWRVRHAEHGGLAAMIALRFYGEARLVDLLANGRFLWSPAEALERPPLELAELPAAFRAVEGRMFHIGGLYVWPPYNGFDLSWHLTRMVRWAGFHVFDAEHSVGIELPEMATADQNKMPLRQFGYSRVTPLATGVPLARDVDLYLTHASREEALERLPAERRQLESWLAGQADPEEIRAAV